MKKAFGHLLAPISIGGLELRNRIAMAPMGVGLVDGGGYVSDRTVAFYAERARGGAGLLITENTAAVYPHGANSAHEIGVSDDAFLPGLTALARGVHAVGGRIAIQLAHHGKVGRLDAQQGRDLLMPSVPERVWERVSGPLDLSEKEIVLMARAAGGGRPPKIREATVEDLERLAADFASAAERARRAGFDAVELHGAHGYLFSEFLSPAWNRREDAYGGPVENRARLLCEVVRGCKASAGSDFPVWCRIDAVEFGTPSGIQLDDAVRTAELLEEAGADAIHVSAYANPRGAGFTQAPLVHQEGGFVEFAARVKSRVSVPVIVAGRIEPDLGDRLIGEGRADVIAMGRKLLADPELASKLDRARPDEVRPCIYCYVCVALPFFDQEVRCAVNPLVGCEAEYGERLRTPAAEPKRILVVGGGPAGMEAASIAAMRGHEVVLVERSAQLGGTLRLAALPYEPNERLLDWLIGRVKRLPIDLRLGQEATPDLVREIGPDHVIAAVGAVREQSKIPGADLPHVWDGDGLRELLTGAGESGRRLSWLARLAVGAGRSVGVTAAPDRLRRASRVYMPVGRRVAIVGGGLVGVELAEFMRERGRNVVVFEEGPVLALEMAHPRRWRILHDLRQAGVRLEANTRVVEITKSSVRVETRSGEDGETRSEEVAANTVIVATGLRPNPGGVDALRAAGAPVVVVGDAGGVGYIEGAIREGFRAAIEL